MGPRLTWSWPTIVLSLQNTGVVMRYTRSSMLDVIRQDYVRTARGKGLKSRIVLIRHALRNALIPVITLVGLRIPFLLSGVSSPSRSSTGRGWDG